MMSAMRPPCCDNAAKTCTACLWKEFHTALTHFVARRVSNQQDCEDIVQEIFVKVHRNMDALAASGKTRAWLYRTAHNAVIDHYRKNRAPGVDLTEDMASTADEEISLNSEVASCLKILIDRLPEIYRQALLLTAFQGMTQKELSEKLGLSLSAAKSRVQRARKMLKDSLLSACELETDKMGNVIDYHCKVPC